MKIEITIADNKKIHKCSTENYNIYKKKIVTYNRADNNNGNHNNSKQCNFQTMKIENKHSKNKKKKIIITYNRALLTSPTNYYPSSISPTHLLPHLHLN